MDAANPPSAATVVHLADIRGAGGVVWSASPGCHLNLVVMEAHDAIGAHRNDEVDVLIIVMDGGATVRLDEEELSLRPGDAVTVARGTVRSVTSGEAGVRYLTVHAERRPLGITTPRGESRPD